MFSISRNSFVVAALAAAAFAGVSAPVFAQDYPNKPVSIVIGTAAGSGADIIARYFADKMRPLLGGQPVVMDNKPGAAGSIAAAAVAKAPKDGYTILFANNITFAATPVYFKNPAFDQVKDFQPVGMIALTPFFLTVAAQHSQATTVAALTAQLKTKGDKGSYGSPTGISLGASEVYKAAAGLQTRQIPYTAMAQALIDLSRGELDFLFADAPTMLPQLSQGTYRVLAVSTGTRSKQAPNVPTMAEAGVTGSVPVFPWFGLTLPSGTPAAIVTKLNTVLNQVLATEETIKFLATSGWEPIGGSVRDFEQMQAKEIEAWAHIGRVAKIEAQ